MNSILVTIIVESLDTLNCAMACVPSIWLVNKVHQYNFHFTFQSLSRHAELCHGMYIYEIMTAQEKLSLIQLDEQSLFWLVEPA